MEQHLSPAWRQFVRDLPEDSAAKLLACFEQEEGIKGHFLHRQGKVCKHLWFLEKGVARYFHTDESGKETNDWFAFEGEVMTISGSVFKAAPADESIQLLENAVYYRIAYADLQALMAADHALCLWYLGLLEQQYMLQMEDRLMDLQYLSARERYEKLLRRVPNILQRISLGHIASFLNITQESLSRIRAGKW